MKEQKFSAIKNDLGIIKHFLKIAHRLDGKFIPMVLISSLFKAATPLINIIMPKYIIEELMTGRRINVIVMFILITIVGNFILNFTNRYFNKIIEIKNEKMKYEFDLVVGKKIMDLDFEKTEDPEILNLKEQALFPIKNLNVIKRMIDALVDIISQGIMIVTLGGIIFSLNIFLVGIIITIVLLNSFVFNKIEAEQYKFSQDLIPVNREFGYYLRMTTDFSMGKDVRLYNSEPLIMEKIKDADRRSIQFYKNMCRIQDRLGGITLINLQAQMLVIYGYIAYKVFLGVIGIGDFTLYTSAAINFSSSLSQIFNTYIDLIQMCRYLDLFLKFENVESYQKIGNKSASELNNYKIEFKDVYFKYPRAIDYALKNINITIEPGEKLSIVGTNGAGKTTFIKLLARLYIPTKGEILLNGININQYDYDEYMKLLSVVFQDYKLFSFSIKENISLTYEEVAVDIEVNNAIEKSGFDRDLKKLEKGIYTPIYKNLENDGIEFSGGQLQKLAMARAIYKDAPIVILDEPTATLDPFSEFEVYSKFNELVGEKTTLYISHRLASCKFCDRIVVFDKGEIVEYGNHNELVKNDGLYNEMYSAQAQYYM